MNDNTNPMDFRYAMTGERARTVDEQVEDLHRMAQKCEIAAQREKDTARQAIDGGTYAQITAALENLHRAAAMSAAAEKWHNDARELYRRHDRCPNCGEPNTDPHEVECPQGSRAGILNRD